MFIDAPDESSVDGDVAQWYQQQTKAWGYLPNYAPAFATRPDVAQAWHALNIAVRGGMDRRRFEIATIAAARVFRSTYCMAAHCKLLRDACDDEPTMRSIAPTRTVQTSMPPTGPSWPSPRRWPTTRRRSRPPMCNSFAITV